MSFDKFQKVKNVSWRIEELHRVVKQIAILETSLLEKDFQYWNIISLAMRVFFILKRIKIDKKIIWYEFRRKLNRIAIGNAIIPIM